MNLDENNAGNLLGPLADDPPRPSSVDIARAMREGQRIRRTRRAALASGAAGFTAIVLVALPFGLRSAGTDKSEVSEKSPAATTGAPASASASPSTSPSSTPTPSVSASRAPAKLPTQCAAERLPVPDNVAKSLVTAADPAGRWIFGRSYPGQGATQVLLWSDGKATKISIPGDDQTIEAVNAAGVAVGQSFVGGEQVAWVYRDGKATQLAGSDARAQGINASGTIVGARAGQPVRWPSAGSEPVSLQVPDGAKGGAAEAVDDDGTAVGYVTVAGQRQAYVWSGDGKGRPLPEYGEPEDSAAFTVRNGWATGLSGSVGTRWNLRTGQVEPVPGLQVRPSTANAAGWMVGTDREGRGVLIGTGGSMRLPDVFVHRSGEFSNLPTALSDDGRVIAGQADDADGVIHAVAWRCR
ncbi:hypothetical protein ABZS66_13875 [Dactylosporangium sp. NPDC005572]|uniref:hypothetical protein n=1 Tax=Dactylosporangium sp. NPDC005572 TaxID=3156889 RepID=UPI00339EA25B